MLRMYSPSAKPATPAPEEEAAETPMMMDQEGPTDDESADDQGGAGKVDPNLAVYMGPEEGPFKCSNCEYFQAPTTCSILSGPVEADGCCNLFSTLNGGNQGQGMEEADQDPSMMEEGGQDEAPQDESLQK